MRAVQFDAPGGPDVLYLGVAEMPKLGPGEVMIAVHTAGVNRPDVLQRLGRYPVPPDASPILGLEVAGVITATGAGAGTFEPGDRVMALVHGGGYAEYCCADSRHVMRIPPDLPYSVAAAFPEVAMTIEFNMIMRAGLRAGESVLIHGGSSGIGSHAIARANSLGAVTITTSRGAAKAEFCRRIGATYAIDATAEDWAEAVLRHTDGRGVDVVLDMVGGDYAARNVACMAEDGRYALISLQGGSRVQLDLEPVLRRRLTLAGSTLRPLSSDVKASIVDRLASDVLPRLASGQLRPHVHATFSLEEVAEAHSLLERNDHFGKIVLTTDASNK
jgi:putative PIG3 family NAD(P)H quinone oxidoreductase